MKKNLFICFAVISIYRCTISTPIIKGDYIGENLILGEGYKSDSIQFLYGIWERYKQSDTNTGHHRGFHVGSSMPYDNSSWMLLFRSPSSVSYNSKFILAKRKEDNSFLILEKDKKVSFNTKDSLRFIKKSREIGVPDSLIYNLR